MAYKVLTTDDSNTIRKIVKKAFTGYNCDLFEAENGVEGLAVTVREKPDLILLDVTMPVMTGMEMLEKLKAEPDTKNIPVIMLTAESGKSNVTKAVMMGVKDYIVKPFKGDELIERVNKILRLKKLS
jgi:DNA-binding response OmpR family regulator